MYGGNYYGGNDIGDLLFDLISIVKKNVNKSVILSKKILLSLGTKGDSKKVNLKTSLNKIVVKTGGDKDKISLVTKNNKIEI